MVMDSLPEQSAPAVLLGFEGGGGGDWIGLVDLVEALKESD